ncbi:2-oxoglutarate/malate transporter [Nocardia cyriacigeorgica]|uniref:2-oxoglutarate/malate transporter n=1 Tax=Nocardia cyriacigeorgica TaxID=135487 RepID=UPI001893918D|nr:2-oxoglutarate/malate transporter [Nocardia cyriacigeorgica]MBF6081820.1 2-oxoglutarate/malate transporter [Nocardia cyriacigeorgica]
MQSKLLDTPTSLRIAGAAGIGFALLIVSGNLVLVPAGMPSPGSPPDEAIDFFLSPNEPTGAVSMFLPAVWALATLFAAGALAAVLRAGGPAGWAYTGFAGVLLQNATFTAVVALRLAMSTVDDAGSVRALWALHETLFGFNGTFLALAMVGLGAAGFVAGLLPRWLFALGSVAAALQFATATLTPLIVTGRDSLALLGLTGWLLWAVWLCGYGLCLIRHSRREHSSI